MSNLFFSTLFLNAPRVTIILVFTFLSFDSEALIRIEPENPVAGEPVQLYYYDCEPPFPHVESGELFYTIRSENLIQFVGFYSFALPLCPIRYEAYYDLGTFEEGEYTLDFHFATALDILPIDFTVRPVSETLNFTVSGAPEPVNVDLFSKASLSFLLLVFLILTFTFQRKKL
ncbi:MAG: hypothetical protein R3E90_07235 [Marinicella sp.]